MISHNLQLFVNGQVEVVAWNGIFALRYLHHPAHTVHKKLLMPFGSLKLKLHVLFNTGFSHNIIQLVVGIFFLKAVKLLLGGFSDISDNRSKILAVYIDPAAALLNISSLQGALIL